MEKTKKEIRVLGSIVKGLLLLFSIFAIATLVVAVSGAGATTVRFQSPEGRVSPPFELQLAYTQADRVRGLKYVKSLSPREGMLFIFAKEKHNSFWMKDTYLSLDMLFLDRSKKIVGIIHSVPPFTTESQSVKAKSVYVVELLGGTSKRLEINIGDTMIVEQPIPEPSSLPE